MTIGNIVDLGSLSASQGLIIDGASDSLAGYSLSSAGDINGDGISDIIIGSPWANSGAGTAYVVYGTADYDTAHTEISWPTFGKIAFTIIGAVITAIFINEYYRTLGNPRIVENFGAAVPAAFVANAVAAIPGAENIKIVRDKTINIFESDLHDTDIIASSEISPYTPLEWLLAGTV